MKELYKKIFFLLPVLSLSCFNPFTPNWDDELPKQICPNLTEIEGVLCNFKNAYSFKDTALYGSLISSDFVFVYRDYELSVDVSWGRDDEMRTTYGLFQSAQSLSLIWNKEVASSVSEDSLKVTSVRGFNLMITFNPSDITRIDGYANMMFERDNLFSEWKILRWRDESNF